MDTRRIVAADGAGKQQWAQAVVMVALFSVPGLMSVHFAIVHDPDIWWHLRTAQWILQHGTVPRTEPFSAFGAGKTWAAYSWLFELMVYWLFSHLGLVGIVAYTAGMTSAITMALFRMNRRLQADFTLTVLLTFAGSLCLINLWTPRPWLCTILLFVVELDVLIEARRTGKMGELYWLPVLFALWANVHIQFVIGLLVLGMALGEAVLARFWSGIEARISPIRLGVVFVVCILATLGNPYGVGIYRVVHEYATQPGVFDLISEFKAMPFRSPQDYGVLLFALGAVVVLARARRLELFEIVLLGYAVFVSFRSLRDVWVVVVVGSAIVASGLKGSDETRFVVPAMFAPWVAIATAVVVFLSFRLQQVDNKLLAAKVAEKMPVGAVEFVKAKGLTGPLYNDFGWGGYLIFDPGLPVSMDGRTNLYGDERINESVATWGGTPHWAADPDLLKANLVIGPVGAPLAQLLRMSPRFDLAYEDKVAVVFVARKAPAVRQTAPAVRQTLAGGSQ